MPNQFRLAVLILAHANPGVFKRLIHSLDDPAITVFCHVDAKADISRFSQGLSRNLVFIEDRRSIFWGGYIMIEAELALFRAARAAGPFDAYVLISGDTLPLMDNATLIALLTRVPHTLRFREQLPGDKSYARIERIYLPDTGVGSFNRPGTHLDRYLAFEDFAMVRRAMAVRRLKLARTFRLFKGTQWFSVTDALLVRMLDHLQADPTYEEIFRFSAIPDELFFHTLLNIIEPDANSEFAVMGMDWTRKPMPFVFRADKELEFITTSNYPFFRKFSDDCLSLVEKVLACRQSIDEAIAVGEGPVSRILQASRKAAPEDKAAGVGG
jgi:hypothetical protein